MTTKGRPRTPGALRTKSGHKSRSRASMLASGELVHRDFAVYFALSGATTKIGFSGQLRARMGGLTGESGTPARMLALVLCPSETVARALEKQMHKRFDPYLVKGREWFDLGRKDVTAALADCRGLGLQVQGGVDASDDLPVMSGLVHAAQREGIPI